MNMHVKIASHMERPGNFTVIPHGAIDSDSYADFKDKMAPLLTKSTKSIVLDLVDVDYISSAGLGVLFTMKKYLKEHSGDLLFCNLKPQIKRLFEIVKALPPEILFENASEADAYFYKMMNEEIERQKEKQD